MLEDGGNGGGGGGTVDGRHVVDIEVFDEGENPFRRILKTNHQVAGRSRAASRSGR